ncbi:hypothetical protein WICANDRAFT_33428, partial [Wickerhamomyces anomalus NRRL Y-366-8]
PAQRNKPVRKKTARACQHCHKAHMTCDESRPCKRCVARGWQETCVDAPRKKKKYLMDVPDELEQQTTPNSYSMNISPSIESPAQNTASQLNDFAADLEYSILSDIIKQDYLSPSGMRHSPSQSFTDQTQSPPGPYPQQQQQQQHNTYLDGFRNNSTHNIYAKINKPFSYTPGFHALINYLRNRFNKKELVKMAKSMANYRPSFIACTNTLKEEDLIFMEQCFQRTLLEYDKFISISGTPTIVWRRTGQIAYVSEEFCILTGWTKEQLLNKITFIVELMDDVSVVEYFDLFSTIAYGDFRGATMTGCTLLTPENTTMKTTCMWTLKRDVFGIPMMIIGNFLPIL